MSRAKFNYEKFVDIVQNGPSNTMPTVHESSFANLNQSEGNTIQNEEPSFEEMLMQDPHWRNPDHKLVQEMVQLLEIYAKCQKR